VRKVADDFIILRTKPIGLRQMLDHLGLGNLGVGGNKTSVPRLCVPTVDTQKRPVVALYDEDLRRQFELHVDVSQGFITRSGVELPRARVQIVRYCESHFSGG
jgi:hypothetical protein